jgi:hypothetical protein
MVSLSGYVADESPETCEVVFDGVLDGSTYPDESGFFSYTGSAFGLGETVATAIDEEFLESAPASAGIANQAPVIDSLSVSYGYHTDVTITGHVIDDDPAGLTVYFSGAVEGTATTDANGNFTFSGSATSPWLVDLVVADFWDQEGSGQLELTGDSPPGIVDFSTQMSDNGILTVQGTVEDEDSAGLSVLICCLGDDYWVTTDSNGDFFLQVELNEGDEGWVRACACDWWWLASEPVERYVVYAFGGC